MERRMHFVRTTMGFAGWRVCDSELDASILHLPKGQHGSSLLIPRFLFSASLNKHQPLLSAGGLGNLTAIEM